MPSSAPKVINPRVIRILIILDLLIFLPGIVIAIILAVTLGGTEIGPGSYNFVENYISDLGSARYSPAPWLLDGISMISAVILIPLMIYAKKTLQSGHPGANAVTGIHCSRERRELGRILGIVRGHSGPLWNWPV